MQTNSTLSKEVLTEHIRHALYSCADLNSQIPDVDQMAEFLYGELNLSQPSLEVFTQQFLEHLASTETLKSCFYPEVIENVHQLANSLIKNGKEVLIASWTQGNVFLQARKAEIFQELINKDHLSNTSIYASLDKMALLPLAFQDLVQEGCDLVCVIDDRLPNVLGAQKALLNESGAEKIFIHKIRPDKEITHRLNKSTNGSYEVVEWKELEALLSQINCTKLGLLVDKDGVIYNTTLYRQKLLVSLVEFCQSFLVNKAS
jgi:hypothetical protein